jgi:prolyl-tRNA synthetase
VAPFTFHLLSLNQNEEADKLYDELTSLGLEVLYDDRQGVSAGEKFADSDLIGCPYRLVVSEKTLKENGNEVVTSFPL